MSTAFLAYDEDALNSADHFRILMDAMAHPGTIYDLPAVAETTPPLNNVANLVALTLCDHETAVWLNEELSVEAVTSFLRFRCGCPITSNKEESTFAFFSRCLNVGAFSGFADGTSSYPDQSTTLIIQVEELFEDGPISLTGPGIKSARRFGVTGLVDEFWVWWHQNGQRFPLGKDVILASNTQLVALPRTTKALEIA